MSQHPRATTRVHVTRQADHLLGTADWNGAQVARRAARLDVFDEMPFLAEALDHTGRDRAFEGALDRAVKLVGGLAGAEPGRAVAVAGGAASGAPVGEPDAVGTPAEGGDSMGEMATPDPPSGG